MMEETVSMGMHENQTISLIRSHRRRNRQIRFEDRVTCKIIEVLFQELLNQSTLIRIFLHSTKELKKIPIRNWAQLTSTTVMQQRS